MKAESGLALLAPHASSKIAFGVHVSYDEILMAAERETIRATVDDEDQIFGLPTECRNLHAVCARAIWKIHAACNQGARHKHRDICSACF